MNKMMIRCRVVAEAAGRYPVQSVMHRADDPNAQAIAYSNQRVFQQRSAFETGARWAIEYCRLDPEQHIPLAEFNAEASDQSTWQYPAHLPDVTEGQLAGIRMAFRAGAAWARAYLQGITDAHTNDPALTDDVPHNVVRLPVSSR